MLGKGVIVLFDIRERPQDVLAFLLEVNVKKQKHWVLNPDILQKVNKLNMFSQISDFDFHIMICSIYIIGISNL
jgi:hypothetical protein